MTTTENIFFAASVGANSYQIQDMARVIRAARASGETRGSFPCGSNWALFPEEHTIEVCRRSWWER